MVSYRVKKHPTKDVWIIQRLGSLIAFNPECAPQFKTENEARAAVGRWIDENKKGAQRPTGIK